MFDKNERIGRHFRILGPLGEGGMGLVFRALDENLGREVALKFLTPEAMKEEVLVTRFINEGRILATIRHPAVVDIYASDVDETHRCPFLVMELVEGQGFDKARESLLQDLPRLLGLLIELLEGIGACHAKGVLHRDLKPSNLLLTGKGRLKIIDFGVAKGTPQLTKTGVAMGTPTFMSPEQCMGRSDIGPATDLYSIGVMLWDLLTGRPPFEASKDASDPGLAVALKHLSEAPDWNRLVQIPSAAPFRPLLERLLAKAPADRPTVAETIDFLTREKKNLERPSGPLAPGGTLGGIYRLEAILGEGGMGKVFKALDTSLDRPVAVKVLSEGLMKDASVVERFSLEGRMLATVSHPNVVTVYASGRDRESDRAFLVMEFIDGTLLSELLPRIGRDRNRLRALMTGILEGMAACHAKKIIHRDLKPGNVIVTPDGTPKIFDFGIAKAVAGPPETLVTGHPVRWGPQLTRTGMTVGTPVYMSPEQCSGSSEITAKSDIYSLGILFWELLFGRPPFTGENSSNPEVAIAVQHIQATLPLPSIEGGDPFLPFLSMLQRMLDKTPANRPPIAEVLAALRALETPSGKAGGEPWRPPETAGVSPAQALDATTPMPTPVPSASRSDSPPPPPVPGIPPLISVDKPAPSWGKRIALLLLLIALGAGGWWWLEEMRRQRQPDEMAAVARLLMYTGEAEPLERAVILYRKMRSLPYAAAQTSQLGPELHQEIARAGEKARAEGNQSLAERLENLGRRVDSPDSAGVAMPVLGKSYGSQQGLDTGEPRIPLAPDYKVFFQPPTDPLE